MRVTRLEVFGFKSFMERTILPFEGGITGVVGPNGCGKSNIVDGLRWVLGETRASNLRGELLEDVIFNGTDKLRPLGLAEVSITLRSHGENFFADLTNPGANAELRALLVGNIARPEPIEAKDDADEEGASEESSNEQNSEEGASERKVPHLTVIEGGAAAAAAASEGEAISESTTEVIAAEAASNAAGSAPEQVTPETASAPVAELEDGLEGVSQALLNRFTWLKSANEVQITRRLYRSGESEFFINRVPCRLKDIRDLLRAVGLGPRSYTIVAQGEVGRIISAKPEERRTIIEEAAGVLGLRDRIAATNRRIEETTTNLARLKDVIGEVTRQVASLKRQAGRAIARQEIKTRVHELDQKLYLNRLIDITLRQQIKVNEVTELQSREQGLVVSLQGFLVDEESARNALAALDVSGDALRSQIDSLREELNNRARVRYEKNSRVQQIAALLNAKSDELKRIEERRTVLEQRREESAKEVEILRARFEAVSQELSSIERSNDEELRQCAAELHRLREQLRTKEQETRQAREKLVSMKSSFEEVQRQIISFSPLTQLQKTIGGGGQVSQSLAKIKESTRLFADGLKVPADHARAVQAVLAERSAFLVAEDPFAVAASFTSSVLNDQKAQRAGLGLGVLRAGATRTGATAEGGEASPCPFPSILSLVSCDDFSARAAQQIFNAVYLCPNLEAAFGYFRERLAAAPDAVHPETLVTPLGEILTAESFFTLKSEGGIIHLRNRADDLQGKITEADGIVAAVTEQRDALNQAISQAEEQHRRALKESQDRQAKLRQLANEQGSVRGRLEAADRLSQQVTNDLYRIGDQVRENQARTASLTEERVVAIAELESLSSDEETAIKEKLNELNGEYQKLEPVRRESRQKLSASAQKAEEGRRGLERLRAQISNGALEQQKLVLETEHVQERINAEYGAEFLAAVVAAMPNAQKLPDEEKAALQDEAEKLKQRIIREGEVDPSSIEAHEVERQRLDTLISQEKDLEDAISGLQSSVEQLTKTSQERFLHTFDTVRTNFSALIPRLFGGGKGSLELTDPAHPLESGVEIVARPPGKKLKSIELMSGGEKALSATALIFSMFLVRPSPLCVLDEVDAPLDEANLVRLLSMIKEMCTKTQFLMITHNKQSMAVANNLVGVTMQEPGATRIITVSLQEAIRHVG